MKRRDFLVATSAALAAPALARFGRAADECACDRTYASVQQAIASTRETLAYTVGIYVGTGRAKPDFLATVDVDPDSSTHSQIVHRLYMPYTGDELHHYGWNACSSCHGDDDRPRRYIVLPGLRSSRIYIVDTENPREPRMHKVIEPREVIAKSGLTAPHTVHCLADGTIMVSMLGDKDGNGPGGFLLMDEKFDVVGRWERNAEGMKFNYDFWYQPRHNVMVSSEWAAPKTNFPGFKLEDVEAGNYGRQIHFWDWEKREIVKSVDLGAKGMIPLEVRFHHNPESTHGYVGAALSTVMWHWHRSGDDWVVKDVISVDPVEVEGWPFPVPGLMTDLLLSMDDRSLYFSNWLHGDVRRYDISDPARPVLKSQLWLGGLIGRETRFRGKKLEGGPQMLQLSLDGKRLYVTNSLFSSWDDQFYPDLAKNGSYLLRVDCDAEGGMSLDESFMIDFAKEPGGPARAHEIRFPGGDSTSDIWG